ncbi:hypothetical protein CPT_MarsHill_252 [Staphylococcus phage MarsHill]|nr:hypothetical protein CPT_MarsHill_252 [Staphylococcus phage MarsHill]
MIEQNLVLLLDVEDEKVKGISFTDDNLKPLNTLELEPGDEISISVTNNKDKTSGNELLKYVKVKDLDSESGVYSEYIPFENMFRFMSGSYFYTITKHPMTLYVTGYNEEAMDYLELNLKNYNLEEQ